MKPNTSRQEILIFTRTALSKRQLAEKNDGKVPGSSLSPAYELERICWAGLLYEILPEVVSSSEPGCSNYIWEIVPAENFIRIAMGPCPEQTPAETSIDPHLFLLNFFMN